MPRIVHLVFRWCQFHVRKLVAAHSSTTEAHTRDDSLTVLVRCAESHVACKAHGINEVFLTANTRPAGLALITEFAKQTEPMIGGPGMVAEFPSRPNLANNAKTLRKVCVPPNIVNNHLLLHPVHALIEKRHDQVRIKRTDRSRSMLDCRLICDGCGSFKRERTVRR